MRVLPFVLGLAPVLLVACNGKDSGDDTGPLFVGPELSHTAPSGALEGSPLEITVTATDLDGVATVTLFHRIRGEAAWSQLNLTGAGSDAWVGTLDGDDVQAPAIEYYFKAVDAGETPATSYLPVVAASEPFELPVGVTGFPLPFVEDFESQSGEDDLSQLGWGSASDGFRGYPWQLSSARAQSGTRSALHPHGYEDISTIRDWLVSPPLDFSAVGDVQVTWREYGSDVSTATHKLYISTGAQDPAAGDYVPVTEALPAPPESAWGRSAVYDLSAWAGATTAYLAWYWEGVDADDWYIDDVRVETRQPDLAATWVVDPSPIDPGDAGTLTLTVTNAGLVDATGVSVAVDFPDGGATGGEATLSGLASGASDTVDIAVAVDASAPDNRYLPMRISLSSGAAAVEQDELFLVGTASTATFTWYAAEAGNLGLVIGVGDPDAPTWSTTVYSGAAAAGESEYTFDLTDQGDLLPPSAGDLRWWCEGSFDGTGTVRDFTIAYDGAEYSATRYPAATAGGSVFVWLPEPPDLTVSLTSPANVDPGATGLAIAASVTNDGAPTSGGVVATLSSTDPDVTITDAGPVTVSAGSIGSSDRLTLSGFSFDISEAHVDSTPVELDLTLADDLESWSFPLRVTVPFPVLVVTELEVDDDGRDGVIDPDEAAELTVHLTNVGDEATVGTVTGTLSLEDTSTATADVSTNSESFGTISATATRTARPYTVQVTSGAAGDTLDLLLTLVDGSRSYLTRMALTLGEPPYQAIYPLPDETGDALDDEGFDLYSGSYRANAGVLQIRLTSAREFDPDTLFVEAWGVSTGADWVYYRLVLQTGIVTLQGYDGSFQDLGEVGLSFPDSTTVQFDIPIDALGLFLDEISFGWGTGWCGPPDYYCDHWPDGWGYPYYSFSTASWFDLSW